MSRTGFADRAEAGRRLAARLAADPAIDFAGPQPIVLGLPRGGVPVAAEVARALGLPLDLLVVRKLGIPGHEEVAFGAIGGQATVIDADLVRRAALGPADLARVEERERAELVRREDLYRAGSGPLTLDGRPSILVDDGIATGATMRAACRVARAAGASRVVVAVPVAPARWAAPAEADAVVTVLAPDGLASVGQWYDDFAQTTDAEVLALLAAARPDRPADAASE